MWMQSCLTTQSVGIDLHFSEWYGQTARRDCGYCQSKCWWLVLLLKWFFRLCTPSHRALIARQVSQRQSFLSSLSFGFCQTWIDFFLTICWGRRHCPARSTSKAVHFSLFRIRFQSRLSHWRDFSGMPRFFESLNRPLQDHAMFDIWWCGMTGLECSLSKTIGLLYQLWLKQHLPVSPLELHSVSLNYIHSKQGLLCLWQH